MTRFDGFKLAWLIDFNGKFKKKSCYEEMKAFFTKWKDGPLLIGPDHVRNCVEVALKSNINFI